MKLYRCDECGDWVECYVSFFGDITQKCCRQCDLIIYEYKRGS